MVHCFVFGFVCLFVCFESHEQFFSYLATVTIADVTNILNRIEN
jgi:hypothetical protein